MKKSKIAIIVSALVIVFAVVFSFFKGRIENHPLLYPIENSTVKPDGYIYEVAIVGTGASGIMALRRAVLNNDEVLLFSGNTKNIKNSRGTYVRDVDNIPGLEKYERVIINLRNEALTDIAADKNFGKNLNFFKRSVVDIKQDSNNIFTLKDNEGAVYKARYVILATGMMDEQPVINGKISKIFPYANNQTIAYCVRCDGHRSIGKKTVIIGSNESAASIAIILQQRYKLPKITILTHGKDPEWSQSTQQKLEIYGIEFIQSEITSIEGDESDGKLEGFKFSDNTEISAEFGFVSMGIRPNNQLVNMLGAKLDPRGLVIADENSETNVQNLFVIGDLQANAMKQIYSGWNHAVKAADTINRRVRDAYHKRIIEGTANTR